MERADNESHRFIKIPPVDQSGGQLLASPPSTISTALIITEERSHKQWKTKITYDRIIPYTTQVQVNKYIFDMKVAIIQHFTVCCLSQVCTEELQAWHW